jgi:hypothetical protein
MTVIGEAVVARAASASCQWLLPSGGVGSAGFVAADGLSAIAVGFSATAECGGFSATRDGVGFSATGFDGEV